MKKTTYNLIATHKHTFSESFYTLHAKTDIGAIRQAKKIISELADVENYNFHLLFRNSDQSRWAIEL